MHFNIVKEYINTRDISTMLSSVGLCMRHLSSLLLLLHTLSILAVRMLLRL